MRKTYGKEKRTKKREERKKSYSTLLASGEPVGVLGGGEGVCGEGVHEAVSEGTGKGSRGELRGQAGCASGARAGS